MVPEFRLIHAVIAIAALLSTQMEAFAAPFVYSLDNRPRAPNGADVLAIGAGNGAEDPFGILPNPQLIGPSPSLETFSGPPLNRKLSDADLLIPGVNAPVVNTRRPSNTNYLDAISTNFILADEMPLRLAFSVDRASQGVVGSAVHEQFLLNQHPGDIFISDREFNAPSEHVGTLLVPGWAGFLPGSGVLGSNRLLVNQSTLKLQVPVGGVPNVQAESNVLADPITPGTHDHVDAFDFSLPDTSGNLVTDEWLYFSVNPDQPVITPPPPGYTSAADIYRIQPGSTVKQTFATANQMGLDNPWINRDDIDALIVYDLGVPGFVDPGTDYALFSLSPGSYTLNHYGLTAADVFFTDFQGSFATFATDLALGLQGTINPAASPEPGDSFGASSGIEPTDNNSGLSPVFPGDMDGDEDHDAADVASFVQGLTRPRQYHDLHKRLPHGAGDFTEDGVLDFDDIKPFRIFIDPFVDGAGGAGSFRGPGVPEPGTMPLAAMLVLVLAGSRRPLTFGISNK